MFVSSQKSQTKKAAWNCTFADDWRGDNSQSLRSNSTHTGTLALWGNLRGLLSVFVRKNGLNWICHCPAPQYSNLSNWLLIWKWLVLLEPNFVIFASICSHVLFREMKEQVQCFQKGLAQKNWSPNSQCTALNKDPSWGCFRPEAKGLVLGSQFRALA